MPFSFLPAFRLARDSSNSCDAVPGSTALFRYYGARPSALRPGNTVPVKDGVSRVEWSSEVGSRVDDGRCRGVKVESVGVQKLLDGGRPNLTYLVGKS